MNETKRFKTVRFLCFFLAVARQWTPNVRASSQETRGPTGAMYRAGLHSVVHVTAPSVEVAKNLARGIVKNDLAACVNLVPNIISIYKWKGEVNEDSETLMVIKTRTSRVEDLTNYVKSNHPYEVCEVISTQIENGNIPYLDWISESVPEVSEDLSKNYLKKEEENKD